MHLVTIEHLFEPRHGGASQNQKLFNTIGKSEAEWPVFCLNVNRNLAKLRQEISHRVVEKDTSAIAKKGINPSRPLDEIDGFLKAFGRYARTGTIQTKARLAAYHLISNFPLRVNSIDQLKLSSLTFEPPESGKVGAGVVTLTFDKEILKNGRDNKAVNLRRDSRPTTRLWLMSHLYGTDTYAVLKDYVDNIRPKLAGADGPYLFPSLDRTAPFTDTEAFTPSKLKFGWHSFRHFVAVHVRLNFPEGRGAASSFLLNTERMIDRHYGSLTTEDIQAELEKKIKSTSPTQTKVAPSQVVDVVPNKTSSAKKPEDPILIDFLNSLGGIHAAAKLPDATLDALVTDYSSEFGNRLKSAIRPLR
jgi:hypothetical protein